MERLQNRKTGRLISLRLEKNRNPIAFRPTSICVGYLDAMEKRGYTRSDILRRGIELVYEELIKNGML